MKTIYKFTLKNKEEQEIAIPDMPLYLTVQIQNGLIVLWAIVETNNPIVLKKFFMYDTGEEIKQGIDSFIHYIGTVQNGEIVSHIFEYLQ